MADQQDDRPAAQDEVSEQVHDDLIPEDLPPDHPGREEAERLADAEGGATRGNQ